MNDREIASIGSDIAYMVSYKMVPIFPFVQMQQYRLFGWCVIFIDVSMSKNMQQTCEV